ncbi:MAG: tRNA pseudouridine(55) synthase TruB [Betaproteobacteria bacterium]|nr:tRNA pseudouridine(55) synthase TruB [Betaproteobacteria bacterium]
MNGKSRWTRVDGVLLLDKDAGITSNAALQTARRLFRAAKAGHTGTLDPMATGLLPLCFGEATKFAQSLLDADKEYLAVVRLGVTTNTGDAEGVAGPARTVDCSVRDVEEVLGRFRGAILQIPPMHSAIKLRGKPLYELARQGLEVERAPRRVTILELELRDFANDCLDLRVHCSKGTYIRSLAIDIGEALGCGAHLAALRRTRIDRLMVADAHSLTRLQEMPDGSREALLLAPDALLGGFPELRLDGVPASRFRDGQTVPCAPAQRWSGSVRVYDGGGFVGVGRCDEGQRLVPVRLISK